VEAVSEHPKATPTVVEAVSENPKATPTVVEAVSENPKATPRVLEAASENPKAIYDEEYPPPQKQKSPPFPVGISYRHKCGVKLLGLGSFFGYFCYCRRIFATYMQRNVVATLAQAVCTALWCR